MKTQGPGSTGAGYVAPIANLCCLRKQRRALDRRPTRLPIAIERDRRDLVSRLRLVARKLSQRSMRVLLALEPGDKVAGACEDAVRHSVYEGNGRLRRGLRRLDLDYARRELNGRAPQGAMCALRRHVDAEPRTTGEPQPRHVPTDRSTFTTRNSSRSSSTGTTTIRFGPVKLATADMPPGYETCLQSR